MAVVYWVHLPEHVDIFKDGYVGVTENLKNRFRSHKFKFKEYTNSLIKDVILISNIDYCYLIEQKLRPNRNIGWNKSIGGKNNNKMCGKDNPNYQKFGEQAPNFQGWWITPKGKFATSNEAAAANGLQQSAIIRKCKGRFANNKFYPPKSGWAFEQKA